MTLLACIRSIESRTLPKNITNVRGISSKEFVGNREIVGYGYNGEPFYADRSNFPFPAVRWMEKPWQLCDKEKGDWKQLSCEEKKQLYRITFCQTFSEFKASKGDWKGIIGIGLFIASIGVWWFILYKKLLFNPLPLSFSDEFQRAQLRRMLDLNMNPVTGISSYWSYDSNDWKAKKKQYRE